MTGLASADVAYLMVVWNIGVALHKLYKYLFCERGDLIILLALSTQVINLFIIF